MRVTVVYVYLLIRECDKRASFRVMILVPSVASPKHEVTYAVSIARMDVGGKRIRKRSSNI